MLCPTDLNRMEHYSNAQSIVLLHRPYSTTAALLPAVPQHGRTASSTTSSCDPRDRGDRSPLVIRSENLGATKQMQLVGMPTQEAVILPWRQPNNLSTDMSDRQYKDWKSATELACLADPTLNCEATSRTFPLGRVCNLFSESTTECHFNA